MYPRSFIKATVKFTFDDGTILEVFDGIVTDINFSIGNQIQVSETFSQYKSQEIKYAITLTDNQKRTLSKTIIGMINRGKLKQFWIDIKSSVIRLFQ
jgi:hypothetical protein